MKRIIFVLIATSLLFAGCSKDKSDTSVTENEEYAITKTSSETSATAISDKTAEYSTETSVFADDKNEINGTDKKVNENTETKDNNGELPIIKEETSLESNKTEKTTAQVKNTDVSTVTKTQASDTEAEKTTTQVKNTDASTETKTQTSNTEAETTTALTETDTQTSVAETEKATGGVIELPIIPVK